MQPSTAVVSDPSVEPLPDHTQLPEKDGSFVRNFQEPPQSTLLSGSLFPRLVVLYGYGRFCIGCDSGIYWRSTKPPLDGCKAPDWFYVPGVPPLLDGVVRRSYVLWQELIPPFLLIEFVSGVMTLLPGDVILTGTPAGVAPVEVGDVVEVEVEGVGALRNQVVNGG